MPLPRLPRSALWRHTDFLRLWAAQTVSDFGARITREGLVFTAVMGLGATPAQLGLLSALASGPAFLVGLVAGGFVDRSRRRPILIAADLARAAVLATLPLAAWLGLLGMLQIYAAAGLVGAASVLFDIADHAYLPGLVGRPLIAEANARLSATESVAELGGPALAGVLFQWLTAPIAIAANAMTYLISAAILTRIAAPEPSHEDARNAGGIGGLAAGARAAWGEPRVRPLLAMTAIGGLFGGFFGALYIAFVLRTLHLGPVLLGLGIATGGLGALSGSLLALPMARRFGVGRAICLAGALSALGTLIVLLAPAQPVEAMASLMASQFLGDAFGVVPLILAASLWQSLLPRGLLGRVGATFRALNGGGAVLGALGGGLLGQAWGVRPTMILAIAGLLLGPVAGALSPLASVKEIPLGSDEGPRAG